MRDRGWRESHNSRVEELCLYTFLLYYPLYHNTYSLTIHSTILSTSFALGLASLKPSINQAIPLHPMPMRCIPNQPALSSTSTPPSIHPSIIQNTNIKPPANTNPNTAFQNKRPIPSTYHAHIFASCTTSAEKGIKHINNVDTLPKAAIASPSSLLPTCYPTFPQGMNVCVRACVHTCIHCLLIQRPSAVQFSLSPVMSCSVVQ